MKSLDDLLKLIEEDDATAILEEENISRIFDELLKYDLIDLSGEKVCLTSLGKRARETGADVVIRELKAARLSQRLMVIPEVSEKKPPLFLFFQLMLSSLGLLLALFLT